MVQVKELTEHGYFVMAAITEREGIMMAQCHADEKEEFELHEYFNQYYKTFDEDTDAGIIIEAALEQMTEADFIGMLRRNGFTDIFECLAVEGYLTKINNQWILSLEKYWQGDSEGWEARC